MKYICFGDQKGIYHRIAFRLRRGRRVMQSKCGVRLGANDWITRTDVAVRVCKSCLA